MNQPRNNRTSFFLASLLTAASLASAQEIDYATVIAKTVARSVDLPGMQSRAQPLFLAELFGAASLGASTAEAQGIHYATAISKSATRSVDLRDPAIPRFRRLLITEVEPSHESIL